MSYRTFLAASILLCVAAATSAAYASRNTDASVFMDGNASKSQSLAFFTIPVTPPVRVLVSGPVYPPKSPRPPTNA